MLCTPALATSGTMAGMAVALQTWRMPPCGQPHVEVATPAEYGRAHGTANFGGVIPLAWADESRCVIVINRTLAPTMINTAVKRCHVIVHEWGHLAGHDHSENQRSVMFGGDTVSESREWLGRHRWRWVVGGAFRPCYAAVAR